MGLSERLWTPVCPACSAKKTGSYLTNLRAKRPQVQATRTRSRGRRGESLTSFQCARALESQCLVMTCCSGAGPSSPSRAAFRPIMNRPLRNGDDGRTHPEGAEAAGAKKWLLTLSRCRHVDSENRSLWPCSCGGDISCITVETACLMQWLPSQVPFRLIVRGG